MSFETSLLLNAVPDGRVFGLDQQTWIQIGVQLFNACLLAAALGFILYKPVRKFMQERTQRVRGQLKEAEDTMEEANRLKAEYEEKLREIDIERTRILEAARRTASEREKHVLEEARHEAATIRRRTEESIQHEKERLKKETRLHIIEVSSLMAEKFVRHTIDSKAQDRLFEETMAELEEEAWLN